MIRVYDGKIERPSSDKDEKRYYKQMRLHERHLQQSGYVSAVALSHIQGIGMYATRLKDLARKQKKIDCIKAIMGGSVKYYYKKQQAIFHMKKMAAEDAKNYIY